MADKLKGNTISAVFLFSSFFVVSRVFFVFFHEYSSMPFDDLAGWCSLWHFALISCAKLVVIVINNRYPVIHNTRSFYLSIS